MTQDFVTQDQGSARDPQLDSNSAHFIDAFEFVRLGRLAGRSGSGKILQGNAPLDDFERLIDEDAPEQNPDALVEWSAQADQGPKGESLIRLHVKTDLILRCERCLGPLPMHIESDVALQLVESESELDDPDSFDFDTLEKIDPDADFEKVLGSRQFDLLEQVEDELILCVPYVPRHDVCPENNDNAPGPANSAEELDAGKPVSPFAMLAKLKTRDGVDK